MNTQSDPTSDKGTQPKQPGFFSRVISKVTNAYRYATDGVWNDPRDNITTRMTKTANLTINALLNSSLQNKSMSLTYQTVLSIVPAFALLVAIGRGFGLQDLMQGSIYQFFPSQTKTISTVLKFVDSYLTSATQGVFVGVGIVVLLWTVISLLSSIEDTFNSIWGVRTSRTFYQKITDYIAICLMIPILMICSSGVSIFMSSVVQDHLELPFLTDGLNLILELVPLGLCWLAFTLSYFLIPNTKVEFKYAAISGALAAFSFTVLQLLFVNGQIYVSKYNAIYGSFAFLPLLLVWLQLSWLILLTGCMIAYSMQNVFTFNLMGDASNISDRGWHTVALIIMAVCTQRFAQHEKPYTKQEIAVLYYLPIRIVGRLLDKLITAGLVYEVKLDNGSFGIVPAMDVSELNVGKFKQIFDDSGVTDFVTDFQHVYRELLEVLEPAVKKSYEQYCGILIKDLPLPSPDYIHKVLVEDAKKVNSEQK